MEDIAMNEELHKARSKAVASAVGSLVEKMGYPADVVMEGAVYGGATGLINAGAGMHDIADVLEALAAQFRELAPAPGDRTQ